MHAARIAELLEPFLAFDSEAGQKQGEGPGVLSPSPLRDISTYVDILRRWNSRINLTAIRDEEEIVVRHFGESLFAARLLFPGAGIASGRVADVGSGAGFPGIPIKLWAPGVALTLIEANHKKATFLHEICRALTLTNVDIQNVRAESLPQAAFDLVTLRAVERFVEVLPMAAQLVVPSGRIALLIGSGQVEEARSVLGSVRWEGAVAIPGSRSRVLLVGVRESG